MIHLLLIPLLIIGPNYDLEQTGEFTFQWNSHYPRLWDGNQWVNYLWSQDQNVITFDGASLSFVFDKTNCSFTLKDPESKEENIKYIREFLVDGSSKTLTQCQILSVTPNADFLQIISKQNGGGGEIKTIFDLGGNGIVEWTYELTNTDIFTTKTFSINEICENCTPKSIKDTLIDYGTYIIDTKDYVHNTVKTMNQIDRDFVITYEGTPRGFAEKEIIDPTASIGSSHMDSVWTGTGGTTDAVTCPNTAAAGGRVAGAYMGAGNDAGNRCYRGFADFDISTIPNSADILSVKLEADRTLVGSYNEGCDITHVTVNVATATDEQIWDDILAGTIYLDNNTDCNTAGNNFQFDLGSGAATDLELELTGDDTFALGILEAANTGTNNPSERIQLTNLDLIITYEYGVISGYVEDLNAYNIGDTAKINGTIFLRAPPTANITNIKFYVNETLTNTNSTGQNQTAPYRINFGPLWYTMTTDNSYNFTISLDIQNTTQTITNSSTIILSREYAPNYLQASQNPLVQGNVNYTISRFDNEDGIHMKVNRIGGTLGDTWQIECISQTNTQALATRNQSQSWPGTWVNETNNGYFNNTWAGFANTHAYISCFNDDLLFSTVSYTNSSLALFGVGIFDSTWGSMLGVPVAVFAIVMTAGQANKRDAPTWIVVILALAGIMATLGFFAIEPIVWGLALLSGMLGLFVNQKVF